MCIVGIRYKRLQPCGSWCAPSCSCLRQVQVAGAGGHTLRNPNPTAGYRRSPATCNVQLVLPVTHTIGGMCMCDVWAGAQQIRGCFLHDGTREYSVLHMYITFVHFIGPSSHPPFYPIFLLKMWRTEQTPCLLLVHLSQGVLWHRACCVGCCVVNGDLRRVEAESACLPVSALHGPHAPSEGLAWGGTAARPHASAAATCGAALYHVQLNAQDILCKSLGTAYSLQYT